MAERDRLDALIEELEQARRDFVAALGDVEPALATAPGLLGDWSARELVAHMGYWSGHAAEAVHLAAQGRLAEFGEPELDVDARNETVARVARETDYATVRAREEAAYAAFVEQLRAVEPRLLDARAAYGPTLTQIIQDDGADHYREHTAQLRAWWTGHDGQDADDGDVTEVDEADDGAS